MIGFSPTIGDLTLLQKISIEEGKKLVEIKKEQLKLKNLKYGIQEYLCEFILLSIK